MNKMLGVAAALSTAAVFTACCAQKESADVNKDPEPAAPAAKWQKAQSEPVEKGNVRRPERADDSDISRSDWSSSPKLKTRKTDNPATTSTLVKVKCEDPSAAAQRYRALRWITNDDGTALLEFGSADQAAVACRAMASDPEIEWAVLAGSPVAVAKSTK